jgi:hypothetical protein
VGWRPNHGRIKPKYNPQPNAEERRHEERLLELPCVGCGRWGVECHHTMLDFPGKRHRRDHRFQVPVCPDCHRGPKGIHGIGNEAKWWASIGWSREKAVHYVEDLWLETIGL